jgi:hypothetical protein
MSRNTYRNIHKQLIDATTLLDITTTDDIQIARPDLGNHPSPPSPPTRLQPKPNQSQCTRSVWTQTIDVPKTQQFTIAMQTDNPMTEEPLPMDAGSRQTQKEHQSRQSSVHDMPSGNEWHPDDPRVCEENASMKSRIYTDNPYVMEGALLRTTMPVVPQTEIVDGGPSMPIEPCPVSNTNEDELQSAFSGFSNFDKLYQHRVAVLSYLHGRG